ncbi:hypothetical protein BJX99DRAFT_265427 [Aspergillus californicus]
MRDLSVNYLVAFALVASAHALPHETEYYSIPETDTIDPTRPEPRDVQHDIKCGGFRPAPRAGMESAIQALRKKARDGTWRPGLNTDACELVSCKYDTKITWCNDGQGRKTLPSWDNIADGIAVISDICSDGHGQASGELDHNDHWRVIVEHRKCPGVGPVG